MPQRFEDYRSDPEVRDIMERFVKKFPTVFESFDVDGIHFIVTQKKTPSNRKPIKLHSARYPQEVFIGKPYIVEVFEKVWVELSSKQKNLAVFHSMCAIPVDAFDPASKNYAQKVKPHYEMYRQEYSASGGVPDWMENPAARDPMEADPAEVKTNLAAQDVDGDPIPPDEPDSAGGKHPVTANAIASVGEPQAAAS